MEQLNMESSSKGTTAEFIARGSEDAQRLIAVLALGMCRAMSIGSVSAAYACHRLFGPAVILRAREAGATSEFLEVLNLASELEAVERIAPHAFKASLHDVETRLANILQTIAPTTLEGEKWLVVPPRGDTA
jgi:hypothetical protein